MITRVFHFSVYYFGKRVPVPYHIAAPDLQHAKRKALSFLVRNFPPYHVKNINVSVRKVTGEDDHIII